MDTTHLQCKDYICSDDLVLCPITRQPYEKNPKQCSPGSCIQHERIYLIAGLIVCKFSGRQLQLFSDACVSIVDLTLYNYGFTNE